MPNYVIEESTSADIDIIRHGIVKYNLEKIPCLSESYCLSINRVIKGKNGEVLAGIKSDLYYLNCLYIDLLWVKEEYRKSGYGSALLNEVEKIAKENECRLIHLDTFDFQALDFYLKHEYEVFGVLDYSHLEHKRHYLKKNI